ncbi:hypothetical protein SBV1_1080022 [Verrucomicrobia bacterium]|nr:hypothetical protein SBV1_1080022 [Verrucomicrobiota bacterium]
MHFRVMSNELNTPLLLVCPKDKHKKAAADFDNLQSSNVSYRLRTGTNVNWENPTEVLAVCPVDGNVLYCDGSVTIWKIQVTANSLAETYSCVGIVAGLILLIAGEALMRWSQGNEGANR